jgi:hypothetical protein
LKKSIIAAIIGGVAAISVLSVLLLYYQQNQQQADAQEQHFQDCRVRASDLFSRMSQLLDRIATLKENGDLRGLQDSRAQFSALMNEAGMMGGDCADVSDRVNSDVGLKSQMSYIQQQMDRYGMTRQ